MRFGPQRGHFLFIFQHFFADFGLLIAALVVGFIIKDYSLLMDHIYIAIVVLFAPIKRLLEYLFTYYSIDDEKLLVESGLINKRKLEIPLGNITTVDFTQPLIFQWAKVYSLTIDNGGNVSTGDAKKVQLALKIEEAVKVKQLLMSKDNGTVDGEVTAEGISGTINGETLRASAGDILLMGVLQAQGIVILQIFAPLAVIISVVSQLIFDKNVNGEEMIYEFFLKLTGPVLIVGLIVILYAVGICFSVAMSFIKYYGFRVTDRQSSLFIEYGLFTKKTYTLMKEKISGVNFRQSVLMRLAKKGTLEVFAIGYGGAQGGEEAEVAILYPLLPQKKLYAFMDKVLPETGACNQFVNAQPKAAPYFFLCFRFFAAVIVLAAGVIMYEGQWNIPHFAATGGLAVGIIVFVLAVLSVWMEYRHTGIYGTGKSIGITCGGFTKSTVFMKLEKVESISERASLMKKRHRKITTITLGILAPSAVSHQRVRNVNLGSFYEIKEKLIY